MKRFVTLVVACLVLTGCWGPPTQKRLQALMAEGDAIIVKLEAYKTKHGAYPETLQEAGVSAVQTKYGPWEYSSDSNGIYLAVGDYRKHLFKIWWQPDLGTWYIDT